MSPLTRLVIAIFGFVCAWLITAAFDAMRAPDVATLIGGAVTVVSIVVVVATLHRWAQAGDGGESQPEPRRDEGGGGPGGHWPDGPQPGGGGSDQSWWPEFERQLALYVAESGRQTAAAQPDARARSDHF